MINHYANYSSAARAVAAAAGFGILTVLAACSGSVNVGVDANAGPPWPSPPWISSESVSSFGVISEPGSVVVNGVRYDTSATTVTMNGESAHPADLRAGHAVALRGTVEEGGTRGTASRIDYQAAVVGAVEAVDPARQQAIVLGQTVLSNAETVYDSRIATGSLEGVAVGSRVQVSGFLDADGRIVATRIEPAAAGAALQVTGRVASLNLATRRFSLDRLTVDYGSTLLMDLPGGMPAEGVAVIVRGSLANGLLNAHTITGLPDPGFGTPNQRSHASGWITRFTAADNFDVNGQPVSTNASTAFVNGTVADLGANLMVTVDGRVSSDGLRIRAQRITFGRLPSAVVGRTYALTDFDEVAVSGGFDAEVMGSPGFLVEAAASSALVDRLDVAQNGSVLEIGIQPGSPYQTDSLEARVGLPVLNRLTVVGLSRIDLSNFTQSSLDLNVGGLSLLQGQALEIGNLTATVFGSGLLDLGGVQPIQHAIVNVSGTSLVTLNLATGSTLTGSVIGASSLQYYGTNVAVNVMTDSTSTVTRIGGTRF